MPPIIANGMFRMMRTACFTELKELKSIRKIAAMVMGITGIGDFLSSIVVGALWSTYGTGVAFGFSGLLFFSGALFAAQLSKGGARGS